MRRYKALGLKASIQRFPFLARVSRQRAEASLGLGDQALEPLVWGRDVEASGASGDGKFQHKALAFVGYGLRSSVHDDLQNLDLKGRVALLLRTLPTKAPYDHLPALERSLPARIRTLVQAGVAAVVVLEEGDQALPLRLEGGKGIHAVPVLSMPLRVPAKVCADLPERVQRLRDADAVQSKDYVFAPWSFLNLHLSLKREEAQLPNVIATLPGRVGSKRGEHIVLGAHLDHLGLGERHSLGGAAARGLIHPGADDNASGTALVLELARRLKAHPPQRSVTFLHFSGEEEGLLGSAQWIRTPTVPLGSVKAMLNFDMVGRLDERQPTLLLGGLGMPPSALEATQRHLPSNLTLGKDLGAALGASDHVSFAMAKIPTFFFFTGLHGDYHRPTDTADRINAKGMSLVAQFAYQVARDLGEAEAAPPFDPATAVLPTNGGQGWLPHQRRRAGLHRRAGGPQSRRRAHPLRRQGTARHSRFHGSPQRPPARGQGASEMVEGGEIDGSRSAIAGTRMILAFSFIPFIPFIPVHTFLFF